MHATEPTVDQPAWQRELARGFGRLDTLLTALGLSPESCGVSAQAARDFPLRVPRSFVARMRHGDARDPLLLQVLPVLAETVAVPGYVADPVGDLASVRGPGLLQKYAGRVLLVTTGACAVHCRYCFRRSFPYGDQGMSGAVEKQVIDSIAADPSIHEVILSGGDPLALRESRLESLLTSLAGIAHVRRLRLHSRVPIVLPGRVDDTLVGLLRSLGKPVVFVVHANHPREIDDEVHTALGRLADSCATVLNQSVLLRHVNDSAETLASLSEALFGAGVLPYYLHQLDPVAGAAHFAVDDRTALEVLAATRNLLPGYLVPRLVREIAGAPAKMPVAAPGTDHSSMDNSGMNDGGT